MKSLLAIALPAALLAAGPAHACGFHASDRTVPEAGRTPLAELPAEISTGWTRCGAGEPRSLVVWTVEVDREAATLGVRDDRLFVALPANPLVQVARIGYRQDAAITFFMRRQDAETPHPPDPQTDTRRPFRLFGTICDAGAPDPLDCWHGDLRVKVRVDAADWNRDGALDRNRHQLSIFDGTRLQVLTFNTGHAADPRQAAVHWIEALEIAGLL